MGVVFFGFVCLSVFSFFVRDCFMYFVLGSTSADQLFLENLGGPEKDLLNGGK